MSGTRVRGTSRGPSARRTGVMWVAATAVFALFLTACGTEGSAKTGRATPLADGGWIDDAPPSDSPDGSGSDERIDESYALDGSSDASGEGTAEAPETSVGPPIDSALRAGNIDDNADFAGFLEYLGRVEDIGVPFRALDPTGRVVVTVESDTGAPVSGAEVVVRAGDEEVTKLRTTADGTARFHPMAYDVDGGKLSVSIGDSKQEAEPGTSVTLTAEAAELPKRIPLDIAFAIDTTGSMSDELDRLKMSITSVVDRIEELPGSPDVRLAMTAFRDDGDEYVTATHDFTGDIEEFRAALAGLEAGGGGDTPEALDEAVGEVLAVPTWRDPSEATQLVFVVGDAGGHPERDVERPYTESMKNAAERGVKLIPIAASSTDDQAEVAFRQMAQFTGARFVFLAYGSAGAAVGGSTDIDSTDYEELSLDDLIVRLVADELAARTGTEVSVSTTSTTTSIPPGQ